MSYKSSQLSPRASTSVKIAVRGPWSALPDGFRDVQFWHSWLEFESEEMSANSGRANWSAVFGLLLTIGISAGFWTGVGLIAARFWK